MRAWYRLGLPALAVLACGACSFLLDRNATQCATDADCAGLGFHSYCVAPVCVDPNLGPKPECFYGAPSQPTDFLNQCSTGFLPDPPSECLFFDDCQRLDVCDGGDPEAMPPNAAPLADAGQTPTANLPSCLPGADLGHGNVYVTGSSNFPGVLRQIAPVMQQGSQANVNPAPNPIFLTTNSCTAVKTMFGADRTIHDPPAGSVQNKYAFYFDANNNQIYCTLGAAGAQLDVGESDVYSTTCDLTLSAGGTSGILEGQGPVQAMAFVVPTSSTEFTISREAAREVFGLGGNNDVAKPWIDPTYYFVRNKNTGTQQMIARELNLDPGGFWGSDQGSASNVHDGLVALNRGAFADRSIGIISVDVYDQDRPNLRALAYQETAQDCAYLPDSTSTSTDKKNVRDGHYPIWGPLHFYSLLVPPTDAPGQFESFFTGSGALKAVIDAFIKASVVPPCAMAVQRDQNSELGTLTSVSPGQQSCSCYFDAHTSQAGLPRGCGPCEGNDDCVKGRQCSTLGFCELADSSP